MLSSERGPNAPCGGPGTDFRPDMLCVPVLSWFVLRACSGWALKQGAHVGVQLSKGPGAPPTLCPHQRPAPNPAVLTPILTPTWKLPSAAEFAWICWTISRNLSYIRPFLGAHNARKHAGVSAQECGEERGFLCSVLSPVGLDTPLPTGTRPLAVRHRCPTGTLCHARSYPAGGRGPTQPPPSSCLSLPPSGGDPAGHLSTGTGLNRN